MAIPTLASVDSHVMLIILYYTLDDTGNAACLYEQSVEIRGSGRRQVDPIQYRSTGRKNRKIL